MCERPGSIRSKCPQFTWTLQIYTSENVCLRNIPTTKISRQRNSTHLSPLHDLVPQNVLDGDLEVQNIELVKWKWLYYAVKCWIEAEKRRKTTICYSIYTYGFAILSPVSSVNGPEASAAENVLHRVNLLKRLLHCKYKQRAHYILCRNSSFFSQFVQVQIRFVSISNWRCEWRKFRVWNLLFQQKFSPLISLSWLGLLEANFIFLDNIFATLLDDENMSKSGIRQICWIKLWRNRLVSRSAERKTAVSPKPSQLVNSARDVVKRLWSLRTSKHKTMSISAQKANSKQCKQRES